MDIGLVDGVDWLLGLASGDGPGLIVVRCRFVAVFAAGLGNMGRFSSTTSLGDNGVDDSGVVLGLAGGDGPGLVFLIVVRCRFVTLFAAGLGNMGRFSSTTSLGDKGHAGGPPLIPAEKSSAVTIIASLLNLFLFTGATDDVPCDAFVKNRAWKA